MRNPDRSYRCTVCRWQGPLEPVDPGGAAPCPRCGVFLYPLSWGHTWGVALAFVAAAMGVVWAAVVFWK